LDTTTEELFVSTTSLILFAVDIVAALVLVFAVYYRRHRRRDLVVAFLGINVGVLAVSAVLGTAEIAMGLGLGLFGVLSIIRLRSDEISQREVAYYFAALAMGLIAGLSSASVLLPSLLIALIVVVMWIADHPALLARSRHQTVRLDRAINDSTLVDVRYRVNVQPADALPGERAPHDGIRALSATRRTTTATASSPAPVPRTRTAGAVR
jgi:hypothetical protein